MIVLNFFGAPGAGKTTGAAYVFARLKMAGVKCELATEFAKDAVWEDNQEILRNQIKILGEQYLKITRCEGKIDVLVTDSPLINSYFYNTDETLDDSLKQMAFELFHKYDNINFFINRTKPYVSEGRLQTEEESDEIGQKIKLTLRNNDVDFEEYDGDITSYNEIAEKVLDIVKNESEVEQKIAQYDPYQNGEQIIKNSKKPEDVFKVYTDGACSGNPGPGGWATIIVKDGKETVLSGYNPQTTNNRMEIMSVICGLSAIKEPSNVEVTSDSKYVCDAINQKWIYAWKKNMWKKSNKQPVQNVDLWMQLLPLLRKHKVKFIWIKGHNGNPYNERCDKLAVREYKKRQ